MNKKEVPQLRLLNLAKIALESQADSLASRYGKPTAEVSKRDIIEKIRTCFEEIDWIDAEIERIRTGK